MNHFPLRVANLKDPDYAGQSSYVASGMGDFVELRGMGGSGCACPSGMGMLEGGNAMPFVVGVIVGVVACKALGL